MENLFGILSYHYVVLT